MPTLRAAVFFLIQSNAVCIWKANLRTGFLRGPPCSWLWVPPGSCHGISAEPRPPSLRSGGFLHSLHILPLLQPVLTPAVTLRAFFPAKLYFFCQWHSIFLLPTLSLCLFNPEMWLFSPPTRLFRSPLLPARGCSRCFRDDLVTLGPRGPLEHLCLCFPGNPLEEQVVKPFSERLVLQSWSIPLLQSTLWTLLLLHFYIIVCLHI